jgi:hypothetical protein
MGSTAVQKQSVRSVKPRGAQRRVQKFVTSTMQRIGDTYIAELPIKLVSEANAHTHWRERQSRAKAQRDMIAMAFTAARTPRIFTRVHIVRLSPGLLDTDNLVSSAKHVRDGVAKYLGVSDAPSGQISWTYDQEKSAAYGCRIELMP